MKVFGNENRSRVYMVMEWVPGRLLRHVLREQAPLPVDRAIRITIAICDALDYIHRNGATIRKVERYPDVRRRSVVELGERAEVTEEPLRLLDVVQAEDRLEQLPDLRCSPVLGHRTRAPVSL